LVRLQVAARTNRSTPALTSTADAALRSLQEGLMKLQRAHAAAANELARTDEGLVRSMAAITEYQSQASHVGAQYETMQVLDVTKIK
jgi:hypothetical protein